MGDQDQSLLAHIERIVKASAKASTAPILLELLAVRSQLASQGEDLARLEEKQAIMGEQLTQILAQSTHQADMVLQGASGDHAAVTEPRDMKPKTRPNQKAINAIKRSTLSRHDPG